MIYADSWKDDHCYYYHCHFDPFSLPFLLFSKFDVKIIRKCIVFLNIVNCFSYIFIISCDPIRRCILSFGLFVPCLIEEMKNAPIALLSHVSTREFLRTRKRCREAWTESECFSHFSLVHSWQKAPALWKYHTLVLTNHGARISLNIF